MLLGFSNLDYGSRGFIANPIMSDIDENVVKQLVKIGLGTNDARAIAYASGENAKCDYFASHDLATFYPEVTVVFEITDANAHHHVPLLLSPFAYSTYRGS